MKKFWLSFICLLCVILFQSCEDKGLKTDYNSGISFGGSDMRVYEFEYRTHKYLIFSLTADMCGVVHDPDCVCFKNKFDKE